jgi:hypothetical protein
VDTGNGYHLLSVGPTVTTTEFGDDVNGSPPWGRCRWVRQRPPPSLETTSMAGPLGGAVGGSDSGHHGV